MRGRCWNRNWILFPSPSLLLSLSFWPLKRLTVKRPSRCRSRSAFFSAFYEHVSLLLLPLLVASAVSAAYVISRQRFVAEIQAEQQQQPQLFMQSACRKSQVKCRKQSLVWATAAAAAANLANCTCRFLGSCFTANCPSCAPLKARQKLLRFFLKKTD